MNFTKYKFGYFFTLLSVLLNLILYWSGTYDSLEQKLYDYRFNLRGPLSGDYIHLNENRYNDLNNKAIKYNHVEDNDIIIVGIDQKSFNAINMEYPPYDRCLIWAKAVKNLVDAGVSVIIFDIMFDKEKIEQDLIFSKSIKYAEERNVKIILAANNDRVRDVADRQYSLVKPSQYIINNTHSKLGLVGTRSDSDDFVRRYLAFDSSTNHYPIALQAVMSFKNENPIINSDGVKIGDLFIPFYSTQNTFLINYFGPNSFVLGNTFNTFSLSEILDDGNSKNTDNLCNSCDSIDLILTQAYLDSTDQFMKQYIDSSDYMYYKKWKMPDVFSNKIVIIGSALKEDKDYFNTPFNSFQNNGAMFGIELHANVIQQILDNNHINVLLAFKGYDTNLNDKLISLVLVLFLSFLVFFSIIYFRPLTSAIFSFSFIFIWFDISIGAFLNDYLWLFKQIFRFNINVPDINQSTLIPIIYPIMSIVFTYTLNLSFKVFMEQKDKRFFKDTFGQYISPDLINQMYKKQSKPTLGGDLGIRTAFFTDIRGFSSISEQLSATKLVELLNEYLSEMTDILLKNKGTLDKYEGDAILAMFGAPISMKNHAEKAIDTSIEMQNKLKELRIRWSKSDKWPDSVHHMFMRIGMSSGEFVVGNMGSTLRMDYTMMGDVVNTAARLESAAKIYGIGNCCDIKTFKLANSKKYLYRYIDKVLVMGKIEPIEIIEVIDFQCNINKNDNILKMIEYFNKGMSYYNKSNWENAIIQFKKSNKLEINKDSNPSIVFVERCQNFIKTPPTNWTGIFKLKSK